MGLLVSGQSQLFLVSFLLFGWVAFCLGSSSETTGNTNHFLQNYLVHYQKGLSVLDQLKREKETQSVGSEKPEQLWALAQHHFLLAHSFLPRAEPLYQLAKHYYDEGDWSNSYFWSKLAFQIPFPEDELGSASSDIYHVHLPAMVAELAWLFGDFQLGEFAAQKAISLLSDSSSSTSSSISILQFYLILYQQKKLITKSIFQTESKKSKIIGEKTVEFIHQMEGILQKGELNFTEFSQHPVLNELRYSSEKRHLIYLLHFLDKFLERESLREQKRKSDPIGHTVWGHITQIPMQLDYYYRLATSPLIKTVCETGFNAGHSTLLWLHANPSIRVISFDIKERFYVDPSLEFVNFIYPGKVQLILGDSRTSVKEFFSKKENEHIQCDLVHVDGDHESDGAYLDIKNFMTQANPDTIVLLDDTTSFFGPKFAKTQTAKEKSVRWLQCFEKIGDPNLGNEFCVGKYMGEISQSGKFLPTENYDINGNHSNLNVPKAEIAARNEDEGTKSVAYATLISSHLQIPSIITWVTSLKQTNTTKDIVVLSTVTGYVFEQIKWTCRGLGCIVVRVSKLTNEPGSTNDFSKLHAFGMELYSKVLFMSVGENNKIVVKNDLSHLFKEYEKNHLVVLSNNIDGSSNIFGDDHQVTILTPDRALFEKLKKAALSSATSSYLDVVAKLVDTKHIFQENSLSSIQFYSFKQPNHVNEVFNHGLSILSRKVKEDGGDIHLEQQMSNTKNGLSHTKTTIF